MLTPPGIAADVARRGAGALSEQGGKGSPSLSGCEEEFVASAAVAEDSQDSNISPGGSTIGGGGSDEGVTVDRRPRGYCTMLGCRAALHALRTERRWVLWLEPPRGVVRAVAALLVKPLPSAVEALREALALHVPLGVGRYLSAMLLPLRQALVLPWFGNALAVRGCTVERADSSSCDAVQMKGAPAAVCALSGTHSLLGVGHLRSAQRVLCLVPPERIARSPDGAHPPPEGDIGRPLRVWVVNVHLHHDVDQPEVRADQMRRVLRWLDEAPLEADAAVLLGDLNADEQEPCVQVLKEAGFWSAFAAAHGREPHATYPSGIVAPLADSDPPATVDYIFVRGGGARVNDAWLALDRPAEGDATLFPSDHFGVVADIVWEFPGPG